MTPAQAEDTYTITLPVIECRNCGLRTWKGRAVMERIVAAAVHAYGATWSLPRPNRHHNVLWAIDKAGLSAMEPGPDAQGFFDKRWALCRPDRRCGDSNCRRSDCCAEMAAKPVFGGLVVKRIAEKQIR